jgi:hypothetical protein
MNYRIDVRRASQGLRPLRSGIPEGEDEYQERPRRPSHYTTPLSNLLSERYDINESLRNSLGKMLRDLRSPLYSSKRECATEMMACKSREPEGLMIGRANAKAM